MSVCIKQLHTSSLRSIPACMIYNLNISWVFTAVNKRNSIRDNYLDVREYGLTILFTRDSVSVAHNCSSLAGKGFA